VQNLKNYKEGPLISFYRSIKILILVESRIKNQIAREARFEAGQSKKCDSFLHLSNEIEIEKAEKKEVNHSVRSSGSAIISGED